jgi:murein DD-endopeptidase MepM/ murein hydrolase activator NlpD
MPRIPTVLVACLTATGCAGAVTAPDGIADVCTGFAAWQTSAYVLPYAVNATYFVSQANCTPTGNDGGHRGVKKFGYDFDMPIGTPILAARAGVVLQVEEAHTDGQIAFTGLDNYVVIGHSDGTTALYGHMTRNGVAVLVGESIEAGQTIAFSGNTGNTGNIPHLHFSLQSCDPVSGGTSGCPTLPVTFRNTEANPDGLRSRHSYQAQPY